MIEKIIMRKYTGNIDVQDVFWTSYVRSIYVLCLRAIEPETSQQIDRDIVAVFCK